MWCTRWYLPLLLLPMPTAPPYFLTLFLLALFIQAKPCFYCIVLLVALFFSSCYWQPFPSSSLLYRPWSQDVTTFADALNQSIPAAYDAPLPSVVRTLDRCWCDVWTGGFFEPYNVSQWEESSILRLATELQASAEPEVQAEEQSSVSPANITLVTPNIDASESMPQTAPSELTASVFGKARGFVQVAWKQMHELRRKTVIEPQRSQPIVNVVPAPPSPSLPALRWEYDLRPYGLGLVVDFAWTR